MTFRRFDVLTFSFAALCGLAGCLGPYGRPGSELPRLGDEIVVCGRLFHTGTRVVLWSDPGGFDAYRVYRRFSHTDQLRPSNPAPGADTPNRYSPVRGGLADALARRVAERGWSLEDLQQVVEQFVIHYDVCGTSRRCFETLQDERGLSVHFMLDIDGTIYQTLDLKERARHATIANDRSVGVEIAQMGAYADPQQLNRWYARESDGNVRLILTTDWRSYGASADNAPRVFHPARPGVMHGRINGVDLYQYDFTLQQYAALARLTATLSLIFPRFRLEAPSESVRICIYSAGRRFPLLVTQDALPEPALHAWRGLLGHCHVTHDKFDPGPAFDWERLLTQARRIAHGWER